MRGFTEIVAFRSTVSHSHELRTLSVEIEPAPGVEGAEAVAPRTLPRFEKKARRFVVEGEGR